MLILDWLSSNCWYSHIKLEAIINFSIKDLYGSTLPGTRMELCIHFMWGGKGCVWRVLHAVWLACNCGKCCMSNPKEYAWYAITHTLIPN